jgi:DNA-binding CsgD family transcriptional regulator
MISRNMMAATFASTASTPIATVAEEGGGTATIERAPAPQNTGEPLSRVGQPPRLAVVTIGQSPRLDVVPDILNLVGRPVATQEFGALDGLAPAAIAAARPGPRDFSLYTRLVSGDYVTVSASFLEQRLTLLLGRLEQAGFDGIVLVSTGLFTDWSTRVPLIHGQRVIDAWLDALVGDASRIGIIYPLERQIRERRLSQRYGPVVRGAATSAFRGQNDRIEDAAASLRECELIVMNSVGYSEAEAQALAALTGRPVVTARRVIAGAIRLLLRQLETIAPAGQLDLAGRLDQEQAPLTPREREVLRLALDGLSNKEIGRSLGISHRTVEIHRGRALDKLDASSIPQLVRRLLGAERT